jgi:hypothetical protein
MTSEFFINRKCSPSLVWRALEIVLQHVMAPSNALHGWATMVEQLENETLPDVRDKLIETRLNFLTSTLVLNDTRLVNNVEEKARLRATLFPQLQENVRYFDELEFHQLHHTLPINIVDLHWLPQLVPFDEVGWSIKFHLLINR